MEKLTDFKPIQKLDLPDLGEISCSGLIVVVGPNSSGKSQLLRDIKGRISGEPRELVVAKHIELAEIEYKPFLKCLKAEGFIYSIWDGNDQEQYITTTTLIGTNQAHQNIGDQQLEKWKLESDKPKRQKQQNNYISWFSRYLVTALFLENRLTSMSAAPLINFENQPPSHDLHALHINDHARKLLTEEIKRAFSKTIWSDTSQGHQVCLRIGENGQDVSAEVRHSVRKMTKYRTIESEGDGMKSYVATVVSLLLGRRPVSVIDEPEMCLHPPQAYSLGQFIGSNSISQETATFVATHSSQILRGVLQAADKLQIVRLTKNSTGFSAKHVDSNLLSEAMRKPTVRAETVLDGIFAQAVTIIEADGDRIVYQAAWEVVGQDRNFDIHFTAVGGTGGIADTCQLYKMLGIPVAVVADLDLITDIDKIELILRNLCDEESRIDIYLRNAQAIAKKLQKLPPTINADTVRSDLQKIVDHEFDWSKGYDRELRSILSHINSELNGMRGLKHGGIAALPVSVAEPLKKLIEDLGNVGLFLVPVGELEFWLSNSAISASKRKKWAWANEAAEFIRTNPEQQGDIWSFMRTIGDYLTAQFSQSKENGADSI